MKLPRPKRCRVFTAHTPLYKVCVYLVVGRDAKAISRARREFDDILGADGFEWNGLGAMCSWDHAGDLGLFFHEEHLTPGVIAHELLHATARVLQHANVKFDPNNCEAYTYLCEWLTDWVYGNIGYLKPAKR